jgi:hypothetical protein
MKKIKLLFIFVVAFSSALCFADAKEEEAELNVAILDPIINHFPEDSSYTRRMSKALIKWEIDNNIQLKPAAAKNKAQELSKTSPFNNTDYSCAWSAMDKIDIYDVDGFAAKYLSAWHMGIIQCSGYAHLALITFYFNMMNYTIQNKKQIFKKAALVGTTKSSGNHIFMLVEGDSGTMFAVDPWIREVKKLSGFTKLSDFSWGVVYLKPNDNILLRRLFGVADQNGKLYFDEIYVNENTDWYLELDVATKIRCMAEMGGAIKTLYEAINVDKRFPGLVPWFPRWQLPYDRLVQLPAEKGKSSICSLM